MTVCAMCRKHFQTDSGKKEICIAGNKQICEDCSKQIDALVNSNNQSEVDKAINYIRSCQTQTTDAEVILYLEDLMENSASTFDDALEQKEQPKAAEPKEGAKEDKLRPVQPQNDDSQTKKEENVVSDVKIIEGITEHTGGVTKSALFKCPECNGMLSEKANVCPHCGFPTKPEKEKPEYEYSLSKHTQNESGGARFLRSIAWVLWIGGLILAIVSSIGEETYGYYSTYTRTTFDWTTFFTLVITYAVYGGLTWSVSLVVDDIHGIYDFLCTLQLVKKEISVPRSTSPQKSHGQVHSSLQFNKWKCNHCGMMNSNGKLFCADCGKPKF